MAGIVYIVGAGPGDPGLITYRGLKCIRKADVLIYDRLVNPHLLSEAKAGAELIYVGKCAGAHTFTQTEINSLLVEKAEAGYIVTRLKGGDPFIFGRGGEEAEELAVRGICFEIVPGVTSAVAAPAYAGIPLTHRQYASTLSIITGHEDPAKEESGIEWDRLAGLKGTLVFLMGLKNLPQLIENLRSAGLNEDVPAAVVERGSWPGQKTVVGTLADIAAKAAEAKLNPPAVTVIGEVVRLHAKLNWYEKKPLYGKRILLTRAREQGVDLTGELIDLGAEVIECPTIAFLPPADWQIVEEKLHNLSRYSWVIFTSTNGVDFFCKRLYACGLDARAFAGAKIAAIGPATAERLQTYGLISDFLPTEFSTEALGTELASWQELSGKQILLPRSAEARPDLAEILRRKGAVIEEVAVYHTIPGQGHAELQALLTSDKIDAIIFTSVSTVQNFASLLNPGEFAGLLKNVTVACIGPVTAAKVLDLHGHVDIIPAEYTTHGLLTALQNWSAGKN